MSNLKQIGLGMMMYVQDYDERYPANYTNSAGANTVSYYQAVQPYVNNTQIWGCPSQAVTAATYAGAGFLSTSPIDYFYNTNIAGGGINSTFGTPLSMAAIPTVADVFLLWEMEPGYSSVNMYSVPDTRSAMRPGLAAGLGLHLQGENYVFADGHVKWLSRTSVPFTSTNQDIRFSVH